MRENSNHDFQDPGFFAKMKSVHLTRAKNEILQVINWLGDEKSEEVNIQKEVSLSLISFILRRCDELEYIELNELRFKFNSVLHAHLVLHLKEGAILYKSDDDIKKGRRGNLIDKQFLDELILKIDNWLGIKL